MAPKLGASHPEAAVLDRPQPMWAYGAIEDERWVKYTNKQRFFNSPLEIFVAHLHHAERPRAQSRQVVTGL